MSVLHLGTTQNSKLGHHGITPYAHTGNIVALERKLLVYNFSNKYNEKNADIISQILRLCK